MALWYRVVPLFTVAVVILHIQTLFVCFFFRSFQNEQVPAPRVQLHTQDLDLPRRVHSVPELCQGAATETQAEDLHCETGQRSHGSRVGWDACGRHTSLCQHWESGVGRERARLKRRTENRRVNKWAKEEISSIPERFSMWLLDSFMRDHQHRPFRPDSISIIYQNWAGCGTSTRPSYSVGDLISDRYFTPLCDLYDGYTLKIFLGVFNLEWSLNFKGKYNKKESGYEGFELLPVFWDGSRPVRGLPVPHHCVKEIEQEHKNTYEESFLCRGDFIKAGLQVWGYFFCHVVWATGI